MSRPGEPGLPSGPDGGRRPTRSAAVDVVAAILIFGGLFGATQLLFGDFVITGSLPAKEPIRGVAAILYVGSVALGLTIRTGRGWLPALNVAGLFAIIYLAAFGQAVALLLGLAHAVAAVLLFRSRGWFAATARWRRAPAAGSNPGRAAGDQPGPRASRRGASRRPSGRR